MENEFPLITSVQTVRLNFMIWGNIIISRSGCCKYDHHTLVPLKISIHGGWLMLWVLQYLHVIKKTRSFELKPNGSILFRRRLHSLICYMKNFQKMPLTRQLKIFRLKSVTEIVWYVAYRPHSLLSLFGDFSNQPFKKYPKKQLFTIARKSIIVEDIDYIHIRLKILSQKFEWKIAYTSAEP